MSTAVTDRIEKQVRLQAPRARVWRALTDAGEFSSWFGAKVTGTFAPGARLSGQITYPGYEHLTLELVVEQMEPERLLAWRWHPNAVDSGHDYSSEPPTLVVFELADADGGTLLTVTESGFDALPAERRAEAYRGNEGGWEAQMENIARHLANGD